MGWEDFLLGGIQGGAESAGNYQNEVLKNDLALKKQSGDFGNDLVRAIMVEMAKGRVKSGGFGDALSGIDPEMIGHDPTAAVMKILMGGGGRRGTATASPRPKSPSIFGSTPTPSAAPSPSPAAPPPSQVIDLSKFKRP